MANNESSHTQPSSVALWFIGPMAIALTLLLTNAHYEAPKPTLKGDLGEVKKEISAPESADTSHHETTAPAENHTNSTNTPQEKPAAHEEPAHQH